MTEENKNTPLGKKIYDAQNTIVACVLFAIIGWLSLNLLVYIFSGDFLVSVLRIIALTVVIVLGLVGFAVWVGLIAEDKYEYYR